ncbi:DUF1203 domain-containing protein [Streptomyces sp. NPDC000594]|uniref:DUF1203 domain-containing protein n=1 Tax=Streptomyces sp. NPDC000594 TaxID=3154261 RepID=UPI003331FEDD
MTDTITPAHHARPAALRYRALPIDPAVLDGLRTTDDAGRPCLPYTVTEEGAPLRCCLRRARVGESIALVSYAPLRRWAAERGVVPGAYDEQGPVFIHGARCGGPASGPFPGSSSGPFPGPAEHLFVREGVLRTVRRYDGEGRIAGGRMVEFTEDAVADLDRALDEAFADPAVAVAHVRAVEYGCFLFEVRRP